MIMNFISLSLIPLILHWELSLSSGGGQGDGNPGVMGAGSLPEAGEERAGDGIPKRAGTGRHRKSISQHCTDNFLQ